MTIDASRVSAVHWRGEACSLLASSGPSDESLRSGPRVTDAIEVPNVAIECIAGSGRIGPTYTELDNGLCGMVHGTPTTGRVSEAPVPRS